MSNTIKKKTYDKQERVLFHQASFETIKNILNNKAFKASYCKEDVEYSFNYDNNGTASYGYYIPMVSFSDMFLEAILKHNAYGKCTIGMNIEWAKKQRLNPVLYIEKHSQIANSIWRLLSNTDDNNDERIKQTKNVLLQCIKNVEGKIDKDPNRIINFYEEREWRFIPPNLPNGINYTHCEDFVSFPKPHFGAKKQSLQFKYEDIEYLILENETQKEAVRELINASILPDDKIILNDRT